MKAFIASALALAPLFALADPDPSVMAIKREADIKWVENPAAPGLKFALLSGNRPAPGPYVIRVRFAPGAMSFANPAVRERMQEAVKNCKTPLLLLQAKNDYSTGPSEILAPLLQAKGDASHSTVYPAFRSVLTMRSRTIDS